MGGGYYIGRSSSGILLVMCVYSRRGVRGVNPNPKLQL